MLEKNVKKIFYRYEIRDSRYGDVWVLLKGQRSFALLRMTYVIVYSNNIDIIFAVSFRVTDLCDLLHAPGPIRNTEPSSHLESRISHLLYIYAKIS